MAQDRVRVAQNLKFHGNAVYNGRLCVGHIEYRMSGWVFRPCSTRIVFGREALYELNVRLSRMQRALDAEQPDAS